MDIFKHKSELIPVTAGDLREQEWKFEFWTV